MTLLDWLPITKKETDLRGWEEVDIVFVTGDAYVDHPAFGAAVIGSQSSKVIAQTLSESSVLFVPSFHRRDARAKAD